MKPSEFKLDEIVKFDYDIASITLEGTRLVIFSVDSFGVLFEEMISLGGMNFAKVFIRDSLWSWGETSGKDDAKIVLEKLKPESDDDTLSFFSTLAAWEGQAKTDIDIGKFDKSAGVLEATGTCKNSFIAEQYLKAFGKNDKPVCRYLEGYASGYFSEILGKKVTCIETACFAAGNDVCRFEIKNE
jgi:predicted hydrocarbon binding protein